MSAAESLRAEVAAKNYKIIITTDPYHASRHPGFVMNEKRTLGIKTVETGLTLKEAQDKILKLFCEDARQYFPNWGVACAWKRGESLYAYPTSADGTRAYRDDVFDVSICEE